MAQEQEPESTLCFDDLGIEGQKFLRLAELAFADWNSDADEEAFREL